LKNYQAPKMSLHQPLLTQRNTDNRRFVCPLTEKVMTDAVRIVITMKSFERRALLEWIEKNGEICPVTGTPFRASSDIETNFGLQWEILFWQRQVAESQSSDQDTFSSHITNQTSSRKWIAKSIDTPPTRPQRRGSSDSLSSSSEVTTVEQNDHRFWPCCPQDIASCSSNISPKLTRRCGSLDSLELFQLEEEDDLLFHDEDIKSDMAFSRLIAFLDEALMIIEDV
jgi:hypothetical protein